ncbi:MAG: hypothetical protein KA419_00260 [Acidobacteria bacterium]|nr:hypothetical protein [Acidobacteriota bacterium]
MKQNLSKEKETDTVRTFTGFIRITIVLCIALPLIIIGWSQIAHRDESEYSDFYQAMAGVICLALGFTLLLTLKKLEAFLALHARHAVIFLDEMPDQWIPLAIIGSAAGSLALELAIIRWQGTVWEVFAFYKNFSLLACFAGLGLGYSLARKSRITAILILPLLAFHVFFLVTLRHGLSDQQLGLIVSPIKEQLNMGFSIAATPMRLFTTLLFLAVSMLLTALPFIPIGQICGRLLNRTASLKAYGMNLAGSIIGVLLTLILSFFWTPPVIWMIPCLFVLALLQAYSIRAIVVSFSASLVLILILTWPVSTGIENIYSPYQLLERMGSPSSPVYIRAAGHYFQKVLDLSKINQDSDPSIRACADYYELPYRLHPHPTQVAIVGSGTGNDVAAALRARIPRIDAIEIDPAIIRLGKTFHPESPYLSPHVNIINQDARQFLRTTENQYDMIVYGLLDSHTLLSQASSIRLDSFVYTVEGIRDARKHLKEDGVIVLSFCIISNEIGRKIYLMMQQAFDGIPPICLFTHYDNSVMFAQRKNGNLVVKPELLTNPLFSERTSTYADPSILADVSTDDWPFFYMPRRVYPVSYIWMILLIVLISLTLFFSFMDERPKSNLLPFFFMGCGFMLVETKAITELGLVFGNTWQVIGVVIAAILGMAFLANVAVSKMRRRWPMAAFCLIILSLIGGVSILYSGGYSASPWGQIIALIVLTSPMFFSGIAFSSLIADTHSISGAMAVNMFGAMCGGLLEYNSMYFGFGFLYWIAMAFYLMAMSMYWMKRST